MKRDKKEVVFCQIDAQMSEKYGIIRDYYKLKQMGNSELTNYREEALKQKSPKACFESQFIIMRMYF